MFCLKEYNKGYCMKKNLIFILLIFLTSCNLEFDDNKSEYDNIPDMIEASSYEIAFITDVGQLKDKSFNQGTWEGVKKYAYDNNKTYKYYQPANGNSATDDDRYDAIKAGIKGGGKIIICVGYMQGNALEKAAKEYPDVKFIFIDGWELGFENVCALIYKEEQAGYLAGYSLIMDGFRNIGFCGGGGGINPACQRFGYGYIQGANDASEILNETINIKYSWLYGASFSDSPELLTMLEGWYQTGTEVVFACGGSMCKSAFSAAAANKKYVVGVDVDQGNESNTVITSAIKNLQIGTIYALEQYYSDWSIMANNTISLGIIEDAVGLPMDSSKFKKFTHEDYYNIYNQIKEGLTIIDNDPTNAEIKKYSNVIIDYIK